MEPTVGKARVYEIINKLTGEVIVADSLGSGDENHDGVSDFLVFKDGVEIVFTNPGYQNDTYVVRDTETKLSPNGVDTVEDVVISEPVAEVTEEVTAEATPEGEVAA